MRGGGFLLIAGSFPVRQVGTPNRTCTRRQSALPSFRVTPVSACPALRPRPRLATMPVRWFGVAPATSTTKAAATIIISRLNHTASTLAVYASRFGFPYTGKTRFRRVANPYRVGFEPTGLHRRISSRLRQPIYSNAPGFAWRQCPLPHALC